MQLVTGVADTEQTTRPALKYPRVLGLEPLTSTTFKGAGGESVFSALYELTEQIERLDGMSFIAHRHIGPSGPVAFRR